MPDNTEYPFLQNSLQSARNDQSQTMADLGIFADPTFVKAANTFPEANRLPWQADYSRNLAITPSPQLQGLDDINKMAIRRDVETDPSMVAASAAVLSNLSGRILYDVIPQVFTPFASSYSDKTTTFVPDAWFADKKNAKMILSTPEGESVYDRWLLGEYDGITTPNAFFSAVGHDLARYNFKETLSKASGPAAFFANMAGTIADPLAMIPAMEVGRAIGPITSFAGGIAKTEATMLAFSAVNRGLSANALEQSPSQIALGIAEDLGTAAALHTTFVGGSALVNRAMNTAAVAALPEGNIASHIAPAEQRVAVQAANIKAPIEVVRAANAPSEAPAPTQPIDFTGMSKAEAEHFAGRPVSDAELLPDLTPAERELFTGRPQETGTTPIEQKLGEAAAQVNKPEISPPAQPGEVPFTAKESAKVKDAVKNATDDFTQKFNNNEQLRLATNMDEIIKRAETILAVNPDSKIAQGLLDAMDHLDGKNASDIPASINRLKMGVQRFENQVKSNPAEFDQAALNLFRDYKTEVEANIVGYQDRLNAFKIDLANLRENTAVTEHDAIRAEQEKNIKSGEILDKVMNTKELKQLAKDYQTFYERRISFSPEGKMSVEPLLNTDQINQLAKMTQEELDKATHAYPEFLRRSLVDYAKRQAVQRFNASLPEGMKPLDLPGSPIEFLTSVNADRTRIADISGTKSFKDSVRVRAAEIMGEKPGTTRAEAILTAKIEELRSRGLITNKTRAATVEEINAPVTPANPVSDIGSIQPSKEQTIFSNMFYEDAKVAVETPENAKPSVGHILEDSISKALSKEHSYFSVLSLSRNFLNRFYHTLFEERVFPEAVFGKHRPIAIKILGHTASGVTIGLAMTGLAAGGVATGAHFHIPFLTGIYEAAMKGFGEGALSDYQAQSLGANPLLPPLLKMDTEQRKKASESVVTAFQDDTLTHGLTSFLEEIGTNQIGDKLLTERRSIADTDKEALGAWNSKVLQYIFNGLATEYHNVPLPQKLEGLKSLGLSSAYDMIKTGTALAFVPLTNSFLRAGNYLSSTLQEQPEAAAKIANAISDTVNYRTQVNGGNFIAEMEGFFKDIEALSGQYAPIAKGISNMFMPYLWQIDKRLVSGQQDGNGADLSTAASMSMIGSALHDIVTSIGQNQWNQKYKEIASDNSSWLIKRFDFNNTMPDIASSNLYSRAFEIMGNSADNVASSFAPPNQKEIIPFTALVTQIRAINAKLQRNDPISQQEADILWKSIPLDHLYAMRTLGKVFRAKFQSA